LHTYRTLREIAEGLYKEKGSKFIAFAVPCSSEEEAKGYLNAWRKEHHQACHVCYAYRFGAEKKIFRASDDGEPNNSAGAPILGQIQSADLTNVLIGVVRYYGGTKLGVGGLIHAYRTAAREAIDNGEIIEKELQEHFVLHFSYSEMPEVMKLIKALNLEVLHPDFQLECTLELEVPLRQLTVFKEEIGNIEGIKLDSKGIY
jgi:uncharacterized YigZ family protein